MIPKIVLGRQQQFLLDIGINPRDALENGIAENGITLLGEWPGNGRTMFWRGGEFTKTLIPWDDEETKARGLKARDDDFAEGMGMHTDTPNPLPRK